MPVTQHLGGCRKSFAASAKPAWATLEILSQRILGSSGKGTCYQVCQPEINSQNRHRRKEPIPLPTKFILENYAVELQKQTAKQGLLIFL